jgi:hypothetical protein
MRGDAYELSSARIYQAWSFANGSRQHSTFTHSDDIRIGTQVKASTGSPRVKLALDLQSALDRQRSE